jgi:ATP-dependent RNA helicase DDX19/DBP5
MSADNASADGGLASRISKPEFNTESGRSWADEVNSPSTANPPSASIDAKTSSSAPADATGDDKATIPQTDGAGEPFNGSTIQEPEYDVQIKLADMQADPNNPLFSIKTFEELGL